MAKTTVVLINADLEGGEADESHRRRKQWQQLFTAAIGPPATS